MGAYCKVNNYLAGKYAHLQQFFWHLLI